MTTDVLQRRRRRDEPVRVAVVGVGAMGANHARVLSGLKGAELVAVVDADLERAAAVAKAAGCQATTFVEDLVGVVDAACIAVPSTAHASVGSRLLGAGVACLIEKPLATSEEEAQELISASAAGGAPILVGHIERFNPAVRQLSEILTGGEAIVAAEARRMSAVSGRISDVDVVTDLMIHDLDIVCDLVGSKVVDVTARTASAGASSGDFVTALLSFANGALAALTASLITQNQIRQLQVTTADRFLTVDYPSQELHIFRQGRIGALGEGPTDGSRYVLDVGTEKVFVRRVEPLAVELLHFLDVVREGVTPLVSAEQALESMRVVWEIHRQMSGRVSE